LTGFCGVFDSSLLAEWTTGIGTIFLVIVTSVAVWVAWTQLNKFNENERTKVALDYYEQFRSEKYQIAKGGNEFVDMTPDSAFGFCTTLLNHDDIFEQYFGEGGEAKKEYGMEISSVAYNFCAQTAILLASGKIDEKLLMELLHGRFILVFIFFQKLAKIAPDLRRRIETKGFKEFVAIAVKYTGVDTADGPVPID
jgi:hypothetical protein